MMVIYTVTILIQYWFSDKHISRKWIKFHPLLSKMKFYKILHLFRSKAIVNKRKNIIEIDHDLFNSYLSMFVYIWALNFIDMSL
jgi:hypothetical protein